MTSWILSLVLIAGVAAGLGDTLRLRDKDRLKDGSCKIASLLSSGAIHFNS